MLRAGRSRGRSSSRCSMLRASTASRTRTVQTAPRITCTTPERSGSSPSTPSAPAGAPTDRSTRHSFTGWSGGLKRPTRHSGRATVRSCGRGTLTGWWSCCRTTASTRSPTRTESAGTNSFWRCSFAFRTWCCGRTDTSTPTGSHRAPTRGEIGPETVRGVVDEAAPLEFGEEVRHGAESYEMPPPLASAERPH